jgi:3,4-dihydroxy 2-butanone 4-phosphate synthase/GTP cyclohydrolase II
MTLDFISSHLSTVRRAADELSRGRMVVLIDDAERENEGDLVMAAELVTPAAVNFMARYARGLICLALSPERVRALELPLMPRRHCSEQSTAFTVSIEAKNGVSTGISAADRAHTIRVASSRSASPGDLVSPGHIFPVRARSGGVLERRGHTEGAVDLATRATGWPAAVICEIIRDDGTMARRADLEEFSRVHGLELLTIDDIVRARAAERGRGVRQATEVALTTEGAR